MVFNLYLSKIVKPVPKAYRKPKETVIQRS